MPRVPRMFMRFLLKDIYADKALGDEAIQSSALDWTIVYPTTLTNGPRTGHYRVGERLPLRGFRRSRAPMSRTACSGSSATRRTFGAACLSAIELFGDQRLFSTL